MPPKKRPPNKQKCISPQIEDAEKQPAKKQKTNPIQLDDVPPKFTCPACEATFEFKTRVHQHIVKTKSCCEYIFASAHTKNTIAMSHPPTIKESVTLPCNLGKELEAATDNNPDVEAGTDLAAGPDPDGIAMLPDDTSVESVTDGAFQRRMQNDHINVCLTNSNLVEIELLKQLHDANAPHYLFQNILE